NPESPKFRSFWISNFVQHFILFLEEKLPYLKLHLFHFYKILVLCYVILKCIYFTGFADLAESYLHQFKWGHTFLTLNQELLSSYANCTTSKDILIIQDDYLKKLQDERNAVKDEIDLPPTDEDSDESDISASDSKD
ncbi:18S rRNA aminocarboxypropyltransferase-like, partial [Stegodyphus dumicola]|uniref:18S rRNA aminocarboxypropyltransferase-like n=1 Tax=Stegodyphus dumicola TaxID=202533 RepID=UPI0015AFD0DF